MSGGRTRRKRLHCNRKTECVRLLRPVLAPVCTRPPTDAHRTSCRHPPARVGTTLEEQRVVKIHSIHPVYNIYVCNQIVHKILQGSGIGLSDETQPSPVRNLTFDPSTPTRLRIATLSPQVHTPFIPSQRNRRRPRLLVAPLDRVVAQQQLRTLHALDVFRDCDGLCREVHDDKSGRAAFERAGVGEEGRVGREEQLEVAVDLA